MILLNLKSKFSLKLIICVFVLAKVTPSNAQNYFPLQLDSVQFFKGIVYDPASNGMYQPVSSRYKVIYIDTVEQHTNYKIYKNITSTRDTALINTFECLDVSGGSWLGNKIVEYSNEKVVFLNNKNDSIYMHFGANIGASWLFYAYPDGSSIVATVTAIQATTFYNLNDSLKRINLQYFDQNNQAAAHPFNGKEIILSKNYGAISLPDFYYFPEDTQLLARRFELKKLTMGMIYDFNVGDVFCYSNALYNLNGGSSIPPNLETYHIQNKFYTQNNEVVNYGRWIEKYTISVIPGFGLDTTYSNYLDTLSISINENYFLPEETTLLMSYNLLGVTIDSLEQGIFTGIATTIYRNLTLVNGSCYQINNFEPAPHIDIFGKGVGLFKRDSMLTITGSNVYSRRIQMIGYIKNGIEYGQITPVKEINLNQSAEFEIISTSNKQITLNYLQQHNATLAIYTALGQKIMESTKLKKGINTINLPSLSNGIYFIEVNSTHNITTKKVLIQF